MPEETYPKTKIEEIQLITQKGKQEKENTQSVSNNEIVVKKENPASIKDSISVKPGTDSEIQTIQKTVEYSSITDKKATDNKGKTDLALTPDLPSKIANPDVKPQIAKSVSDAKPVELSSQNEPVPLSTTSELTETDIPKNTPPVTALPQITEAKPEPSHSGQVKQKNTPVQKTEVSKSPASKPTVNQHNTDLEKYNQAIEFADKARDEKNYTFAVNGYKAALKLKPSEKYPQEQINTINQIQSQSNTSQDNYKSLLSSADKAFSEKDYTKALTTYQKASELNPAQKYPKEKIASINNILGQQKALNENYNKAIASADRAFDEKKYKDAITSYTSALKLRPSEAYPKEKVAQLNALLGQTSEQQENYQKAIAEADKNYTEKNYEESLTGYQAAAQIKPGEIYPKQRIAAINVRLGQQKAMQEKYNNAILLADQAYNNNDFITALSDYKTALALSPSQSYPKDQIESINAFLARQKAANADYAKAIMAAEKALAAKDYLLAVSGFQTALEYKPEESYPREKITTINGILALDKEKLNRQYAGYISQADAFYTNQDLPLAQETYKMASLLKPGEEYPKIRYDEIAGILIAKAKALKEAYEIAINDADKAYKSQYMDQAVLLYSKALEIKHGAVYPGQMIARIRKYLIDNSVVEVNNESFILKKDIEKQFRFKPVDVNLRKNNYLIIRARIIGKSNPKLFINYGSENSGKNGGVVLKNINSELLTDFIINISTQDKWFREDNNRLSLYSENGDLEISSIRIAQAK
jgi:tetratricopeptide (TPR) repeat protein